MKKTRKLETYVLTSAEALQRGLRPVTETETAYCACANAGSELAMFKWTSNLVGATMWALEKSVWEYTYED